LAEKKRCAKHEPETTDALRGYVRCQKCGMEGILSNGRPKLGRPRRIIWFRRQAAKVSESV
jgi:hypothetical protein